MKLVLSEVSKKKKKFAINFCFHLKISEGNKNKIK